MTTSSEVHNHSHSESTTTLPNCIKLIPGLFIACLKTNADKQLALWYCLRSVNRSGSGTIDLSDALNSLISKFHYSKTTVYRILKTGEGMFWEDCGNWRHKDLPPGIRKMASAFDTPYGSYFVEIRLRNLQVMDKALSERPSRFDRVFQISRPNCEQRAEMIKRLSDKIPLSQELQEYIVKKTGGFTPAQLEGVLHGMTISCIELGEEVKQFERSDADLAISWLNTRKSRPMGFGGYMTN
jgi:hypothetical protein